MQHGLYNNVIQAWVPHVGHLYVWSDFLFLVEVQVRPLPAQRIFYTNHESPGASVSTTGRPWKGTQAKSS